LAADHLEIAPHRAIDQECMAPEEPTENFRHPISGLSFAQALKPGALKCLWISLEYPRRAARFILIGVCDKGAPLRLLKDEGERIERAGRTHPGKVVGANIDFRLKMIDVFLAKPAIDSVG